VLVKQSLGLEEAKTIGDAAFACARSKGLAVAIAVVGEATYLQYFVSMDGAGYWAGEGAIEKARSASEGGHPTTFFEKPLNAGRFSMVKMRHMALEGGLPAIVGGKCMGAIGVSGAPPHEDAAIAQAGLDALVLK
jgi:glc operon protein GlcG